MNIKDINLSKLEEIPEEKSKLNIKDIDLSQLEEVPENEVSIPEAALYSGTGAFMLGTPRIVSGISAAGADALTRLMNLKKEYEAYKAGVSHPLESIKESFYEGEQEYDKKLEDITKQQPVVSGVSGLAGGIGSLALGGAAAKAVASMPKVATTLETVLPSLKGIEKINELEKARQVARLAGKLDEAKKIASQKATLNALMGAREGLKAGAITSLTSGDAKLLEGELGKQAKQTVVAGSVGAGLGGLIGRVISPASDTFADFVSPLKNVLPAQKPMGKSYELGRKGEYLETINEDIKTLVNKGSKELNDVFNRVEKQKQDAIDRLKKMGITFDVSKDLSATKEKLIGLSETDQEKALKLFNIIEESQGLSKGIKEAKQAVLAQKEADIRKASEAKAAETLQQKAFMKSIQRNEQPVTTTQYTTKIPEELNVTGTQNKALVRKDVVSPEEGVLEERIFTKEITSPETTDVSMETIDGKLYSIIRDKNTGKILYQKEAQTPFGVPSTIKNPEKMSFSEMETLREQLNSQSQIKGPDALPKTAKFAATNLQTKLNELRKDALEKMSPGIREGIEKESTASEIKELLNLTDQAVSGNLNKDLIKQKLQNFITTANEMTGDMPFSDIELVGQRLRSIDTKMGDDFLEKMRIIRNKKEIANLEGKNLVSGLGLKTVQGSLLGWGTRASRLAGRAVTGVENLKEVASKKISSGLDKTAANVSKIMGKDENYINAKLTEMSNDPRLLPFKDVINKAIEIPMGTRKNIAIFSLMQHPATRQLFQELMNEPEE